MTIHFDIQQGSPEWHELRLGKMTGSKMKSIVNLKTFGLKNPNEAIYKLIAEKQTGFSCDSDYISDAMQWGIDNEIKVKQKYKTKAYKYVGFAEVPEFKFFGISPDMIFFKDNLPFAGIEIKCPKSETHIKTILKNDVPTEYMPQFLMYFIMFPSLQSMAFVSYDPRNFDTEYFLIKKSREEMQDKIEKVTEAMIDFEIKLNSKIEYFKTIQKG